MTKDERYFFDHGILPDRFKKYVTKVVEDSYGIRIELYAPVPIKKINITCSFKVLNE